MEFSRPSECHVKGCVRLHGNLRVTVSYGYHMAGSEPLYVETIPCCAWHEQQAAQIGLGRIRDRIESNRAATDPLYEVGDAR
jgi:hypothetical protein